MAASWESELSVRGKCVSTRVFMEQKICTLALERWLSGLNTRCTNVRTGDQIPRYYINSGCGGVHGSLPGSPVLEDRNDDHWNKLGS